MNHAMVRQRKVNSLATIASAYIYFNSAAHWVLPSSSFLSPSPPPLHSPRPSNIWIAASDDESSSSSEQEKSDDNNAFNANSILGETLDVSLRGGGTYSWSNSKTTPKDDVRPPSKSSASASAASTAVSKDRYKRIPFDGCGSILLHQEPKEFIQPTSPRNGRTGVTLWSASYAISYYMDAKWSKGGDWCTMGKQQQSKWTVLELGAGLGLCSAVATKYGMDVVSSDNDEQVVALLKENLERNKQLHESTLNVDKVEDEPTSKSKQQQQMHVHSLDWVIAANDPQVESSHPVFVALESLGGADLVILSDVIYGATQPAWDTLLTLLNKFNAQKKRLCSTGHQLVVDQNNDSYTTTNTGQAQTIENRTSPIVLLGYTQRRRDMSPQDEARFFAMLQAAGMEAVLIPSTEIPNGEKYMLTSLFELRWIR